MGININININKIFTHLSIRTKLVVAFLGIGLIPVLVLGSFSMFSSANALQDSAITRVHASLIAKVERIRNALRYAEKDLRILSYSPPLVTFAGFYLDNVMGMNNLNRMLVTGLKDFARNNKLYHQILLLNQKGEQVFRVLRQNDQFYFDGEDSTRNLSDQDFFWKALDSQRGEIVITFETSSAEDDITLTYSTAIYDRGQKQKGVISLQLRLKDLAELAKSGESDFGNTYLLDRYERFLYNIKTERLESQYSLALDESFSGMLDKQILKEILSGNEGLITREKKRIISYAPILHGIGGPDNFWVLVIDLPRSIVLAPVRRFLLFFGGMIVALAVIGTLLGIIGSHHFTRPILKLHNGARIISTGTFDHRITVHTNDEIEDLAVQFNIMADRLKESQGRLTKLNEELQKEVEARTQQLFQAEKMAAFGSLSAGIAHEIGNPLASMKTNIQVLDERLGKDNAHHKFLERILKEINRLSKFFKTFYSFARPVKPQIASSDIRKIIHEVIMIIQKEAEAQGVILSETFDDYLPNVMVDFQRMQQVFLNLFLNAIQAMPEGGTVSVRASFIVPDTVDNQQEERGKVVVTVSDTGHGIPEEVRSKIFEPFYTTKPKGTGLGLSIAHQIVVENNGAISVGLSDEMETTFTIQLQVEESKAFEVGV